ncbi:MAG: hypothetical protein ABWX68_02385, partial [Arthrobacter sp.]|uniref:hypothetical protein n=1 Tax=Arthrobacter sp. TaxID=1667 RepID=UPI00347986A8
AVAVLRELLRDVPTQRPPLLAGYRTLRPDPLPPRPRATAEGAESGEGPARRGPAVDLAAR